MTKSMSKLFAKKLEIKEQRGIQRSWSTIFTDCSFGISFFSVYFLVCSYAKQKNHSPTSFLEASKDGFVTKDQASILPSRNSHFYLGNEKDILMPKYV